MGVNQPIAITPALADMQQRHTGAHNELVAIAWLLRRGYDVFRNVSFHGAVDIVAMRDGHVDLFDVKQSRRQTSSGEISRPALTQEQKTLGVRCLCVFPDGSCEIDDRPMFEGDEFLRKCRGCDNTISGGNKRKFFCSAQCSLESRRRKAIGITGE